MHGRAAHLCVVAVDPAHGELHVVAQRLVRLDAFPARARHLNQDHPRPEPALVEQLAVGLEAVQDPLGVVEPVDAEQQGVRLVEGQPDLGRTFPDVFAPGDLLQGGRVDRDREGPHPGLTRSGGAGDPDGGSADTVASRPPARSQEVRGVSPALEAQQIRAEQALDHLPPPRKLGEDLVAGERDVVEEPDADVAALGAYHPRHQLKLVIVHPDGRAGRRLGHSRLREVPVDRYVRIPPPTVKLRRGDDVVIQRPQGRVAEPFVVVEDLVRGQAHAHQVQAVRPERPGGGPGVSGPADPDALGLAHDRLERGDQPAGTGPPVRLAFRVLDPVHRQPAGHHHEAVLSVRRGPLSFKVVSHG